MKTTPQNIVLNGGINLNRDPKVIRPYQLARAANAFPVIPGILGKRVGVQADKVAMLAAYRMFGLNFARTVPQSGYKYVAHVHLWNSIPADTHHWLAACNFDRDTFDSNVIPLIDLGPFQTEYDPVQFINYRGLTFAIVPGQEGFYTLSPKVFPRSPDYQWVKSTFKWDPALAANQGSQLIDVTPRVGAAYKQRMVWGNFGPDMSNWIIMADKASSQVFVSYVANVYNKVGNDVLSYNGRHIEVGAIAGESITAMQEVSLMSTGAQIDNVLMILTDRSCVFISGEMAQTDDTGATDPNGLFGSYKENKVNYECGCVGFQSLVKTPYGWVWASADEVWILNGNTPERIGTNIRPALLACPQNSRKHWSMAYANGILVLQLVTGQTVTEAGAGAGSFTTYLHEYYYLDLRDGPPPNADQARWFGPMKINADDGEVNIFSHVYGDNDRDGSQRVISLATTLNGNIISTVDHLGGDSGQDTYIPGVSTAPKWAPNTQYPPGDIVTAVPSAALDLDRFGRMFVCLNQILQFDLGTVDFTAPGTVTGATSGATASLLARQGGPVTGTLLLYNVVGAFIDDEIITCDAGGSATVNGTLSNGQTAGTQPDWPNSNGGTKIDGTIYWEEINGAHVPGFGIYLAQRQGMEYQADITARDNSLDDLVHQKLLRRVDVNISAPNQIPVKAQAFINTGGGPTSEWDLSTIKFGNVPPELGVVTLDNPNMLVGGLKGQARAFRPPEGQLVQGQNIQVKIQDQNQYVIDDSNDYFVLAGTNTIDSIAGVIQVKLTHGYYNTIDGILTELIAQLNNNINLIATLFNSPLTSFGFSSAFSSTFPYFTRISIAYNGPGGTQWIGPLFGQDSIITQGPASLGGVDNVFYLSRCKRLATLLGIDTSINLVDGITLDTGGFFTPPSGNNRDITMYPVVLDLFAGAGNTSYIDGNIMVPYVNSKRFDISQATMILQPKTAVPLVSGDRS